MNTYAESKGREKIDWADVLQRASLGELNDDQLKRYKWLAIDWQTCAVGQQDVRVRRFWGMPLNLSMFLAGAEFWSNFRRGFYGLAMCNLVRIERIAAEMVEETTKRCTLEVSE